MNQCFRWVRLMKKTRAQKSRATVPLSRQRRVKLCGFGESAMLSCSLLAKMQSDENIQISAWIKKEFQKLCESCVRDILRIEWCQKTVKNILRKSRACVPLKGQSNEIFYLWFFQRWTPPKPLTRYLKTFQIWPQIWRDICDFWSTLHQYLWQRVDTPHIG